MASLGDRWAGRGGRQALVTLPARRRAPLAELGRRGLLALVLLLTTTFLVWLDRDAYADNVNADGVNFLDALYYATVTMTTTGYGDITPTADHARLLNAILITPMRVLFLVLLVGTTIEVLANEGRRMILDARWRKHMRNHIVIIGFGTKGRSAVATLRRSNADIAQRLVVIDGRPQAIADAGMAGLAAIEGDATRRDILRRAEIAKAREVIITLDRDDSAILVCLTVRQLNPSAHVVVAVREHENGSLLRQSGADAVVTSSDAVGRLLGLSAVSPNIGLVIEDLLTTGDGLEVGQRPVTDEEVGKSPLDVAGEQVIGVVRNLTLRRFYDPTVAVLEADDELVVVRRSVPARHGGQRRPVVGDTAPATDGDAPDPLQRPD